MLISFKQGMASCAPILSQSLRLPGPQIGRPEGPSCLIFAICKCPYIGIPRPCALCYVLHLYRFNGNRTFLPQKHTALEPRVTITVPSVSRLSLSA